MNTSRLPIVWCPPLKDVHCQPAMIIDISCRGADDYGQDTGSDFGQQCEHLKSLRKIVFSDLDEGKFSTEETVPITDSYFRTWQAPWAASPTSIWRILKESGFSFKKRCSQASRIGLRMATVKSVSIRTKMAGITPRPFAFVNRYQRGGGGAAEAVPPFRSGVMRRTVTRRFSRDGPSVSTFRFCSP